jgi:hypothetical protein
MSQKVFQVTPEFKERLTEILQAKKFGAVFPYMNLVNREGFVYTEEELNSLVALLSEFPYGEVAEFFSSIKQNVSELNEENVEEKEEVSSEG